MSDSNFSSAVLVLWQRRQTVHVEVAVVLWRHSALDQLGHTSQVADWPEVLQLISVQTWLSRVTTACFCDYGSCSRSEALTMAVTYGDSTSTTSFSKKVGAESTWWVTALLSGGLHPHCTVTTSKMTRHWQMQLKIFGGRLWQHVEPSPTNSKTSEKHLLLLHVGINLSGHQWMLYLCWRADRFSCKC